MIQTCRSLGNKQLKKPCDNKHADDCDKNKVNEFQGIQHVLISFNSINEQLSIF